MPRLDGSCKTRRPGVDPLEPRRLLSAQPRAAADRPPTTPAAEVNPRDADPPAGLADADEAAEGGAADRSEDRREEDAAVPPRDAVVGAQPVSPTGPPMTTGEIHPPTDRKGATQAVEPPGTTPDRVRAVGAHELLASMATVGGPPPAPGRPRDPMEAPELRNAEDAGPTGEPGAEPGRWSEDRDELPTARASDPISDLLPFDRAALDAAVDHFFEGLGDLGAGLADLPGAPDGVPAAVIATAAALLAVEIGRRQLRRGDDDESPDRGPLDLRLGLVAGPGWPGP